MCFHTLRLIDLFHKNVIKVPKVYIFTISDLLSENLALPANIKFELRRDDFIRTGRFSAKLRLLHQGVTGGLDCSIPNYEARQRRYKLELTGRSVKYRNTLLWTAKARIIKKR